MLDGIVVVGRVVFETVKEVMLIVDMDELEEGAVFGCNVNRMFGSVDFSVRVMVLAIVSVETFGKVIDVLVVELDMVISVDDDGVDEIVLVVKLLLVVRRFIIV